MSRRGVDRPGHSARELYHPVQGSSGRLQRIVAWRRSRASNGGDRTMHLASPVQARPGGP
ncbi:hypothetical protein X777_00590 [Ooceraea biroi]|uniref:Uncharacterized protein n=1 Tax=Ooceraea biroi TaxID=2015173 RepID=A0A026X1S6_OOCBI|nr:hypothetical protein X777_00590 [Ooceraea biroi]